MPDHGTGQKRFTLGHQLVRAHDYLRQELSDLRDLLNLMESGALDGGDVRARLAAMAVRRDFTAYCRAHCALVGQHHTKEDRELFPFLRRAFPDLADALDRLEQEHHLIHGIVERLDRALTAGPDRIRAEFDQLNEALLGHLEYEEEVLVEPLSRFAV